MLQSKKASITLASIINTGFLLLTLSTNTCMASQKDSDTPIVVTIKPLYSLVSHLTEGIETPVLLIRQMQSPHHYSMRPSERRLLSDARMIVWVGPQMETYLAKVIHQQDAILVTATQADGLRLLEQRNKDHRHEEENGTDESPLDPHIWLSTQNAIAISRHISQQLIVSDPNNTARYQDNLQQLIMKINRTASEIRSILKNNRQAFITYHDAFQYFEDENDLNHIDTISFDEETGVSLKHLRHITESIKNNNVQCLLYQPPRPDIIDSLSDRTAIKAYAIDPLGQGIDNENQAWFEIMRSTALNFNYCLND